MDAHRKQSHDFDVVIVGASIAGCTAAILLARAGADVLLIERAPEMSAYKKLCGHFMQASAVPTIERIGLLEPMMDAGAVRSGIRQWTGFGGWIEVPPQGVTERSINLRRLHLDPILRELTRDTEGVDLRMGETLTAIDASDPDAVTVEFKNRAGESTSVSARLLVGADGRSSTVAKLGDFKERRTENGRFNYAAYFTGTPPADAPNVTGWFGNPQWAGAFPTDSGLTGYYIMPTKDRLPQFKADREAAVRDVISRLPQAPPVDELSLVGDIIGAVELPGIRRPRSKGRIALVGDAAMTSDPLTGVGCGWAFQSAEWLADAVGPALVADGKLEPALRKYRGHARRALFPHAFQVDTYSSGRKFDPGARLIYLTAPRDPKIAVELQRVTTRSASGAAVLRPDNLARIVRAGLLRAKPADSDLRVFT